MAIEVGKEYRIDEKRMNVNGGYLGISSDTMKSEFPDNIIRVSDIVGDKFVFGSKDFYAPLSDLLPLEEETKRQKDIKLLKESEKKWSGIVYDGKRDGGWTDCSCCRGYFIDACDGCPIGNHCRGIGHLEWWDYTRDNGRVVFDSRSEELALNVLSSIGDIRRKLEKEEQDSKEKDSLECYEYVVNGKPTGIRVGEYLRLEIGNVESGDVIPCSTLITLDSPYSGHRGRGCVGTPTGFASDWPDVLMEHFKRNDDGSIKVCVY